MKTWNYNDTIKQRGNYSVCAQRNSKPTVSEQTRQKKSADCGLIHKHKRLWFNKQDTTIIIWYLKGLMDVFQQPAVSLNEPQHWSSQKPFQSHEEALTAQWFVLQPCSTGLQQSSA